MLNGPNNYTKCSFKSKVVQHPIPATKLREGLFASENFRNNSYGAGPEIGPDKYDTQGNVAALKPGIPSPNSMFKSKDISGQMFHIPEDWRTNRFKHEDWTDLKSLNGKQMNRAIRGPLVSKTIRFTDDRGPTDCMYTLDPNGIDKPRTN